MLQCVLQGERIDRGRKHPHMIGAVSFHSFRASAAHDIAAPDDDADLNAQILDRPDFFCGFLNGFAADDGGFRGERLSADFE
ncbi:hypothetical protein SDC9_131763 [bioreactor metagenome]|uniref:Uncharacterized protein n=1 Tax=bioreactor metagenome TaxID=1076179 RepID=A0A645D5C5_9ZZZZ